MQSRAFVALCCHPSNKVGESGEPLPIFVLKVELIDSLFKEIQVDAYVSKGSGKAQLFEAIDKVIAGQRYLDAEAQGILDRGKFNRLSVKLSSCERSS